jgi:hypothetical protein
MSTCYHTLSGKQASSFCIEAVVFDSLPLVEHLITFFPLAALQAMRTEHMPIMTAVCRDSI